MNKLYKKFTYYSSFFNLFGSLLFSGLTDMTLEEKIGQLILAPACPQRADPKHVNDINRAINAWHLGGFILKQGTLLETEELVQRIQKNSCHLIVADAEWGLAMRVSDAPYYPRNMTLGAVSDPGLIEAMGEEIGGLMASLGIHMNLAPVVDVNSNPRNPIIYMRSFGDDPFEVARRGDALRKGLQKAGVLACAKHFPGHGDTSVDSHHDLPQIHKDLPSMGNLELIPFKRLIEGGVDCILTAHLQIPQVDPLPVTLSKVWITDILQKKMGFEGLIMTDALNMQGIAKGWTPGEIALGAFLAGHDLLLYGDHIAPRIDEIYEVLIPAAIAALKKAVQEGVIPLEELDRRVEKILRAKERFQPRETKKTSDLPARLYREAITLIGELPLLSKVHIEEIGVKTNLASLLERQGIEMDEQGTRVLVLGEIQRASPEIQQMSIEALKKEPSLVVLFGSPYNVAYVPKEIPVLLGYEDKSEAWEAAAEALTGKIPCHGRLPIEQSKKKWR